MVGVRVVSMVMNVQEHEAQFPAEKQHKTMCAGYDYITDVYATSFEFETVHIEGLISRQITPRIFLQPGGSVIFTNGEQR